VVSNQPASFGALLRQHRSAAGVTQSELAEEAGLSLRGVSDLERGARRTPYADTVRRLADALRLPESERNDLLRASRRIGFLSHSGPAPRALPLPLTSFVGREHAVIEVERLLRTYRLLTLTGPGGIGKTRLALEVARKVAPEYTDAAALVDLNGLSAPELVPETIAAALGVHRSARGNLTEAVADALRSRQLLLLLDNCEHLIEACAQVAAALLQACPNLRVLATSREPLGIAGEVTWIVPPLQVPRRDSDTQPSIQSLLEGGAVRLFVDRVRAVRPEYVPIQAEAADLAEVCCRLEGIPLAIELAAARAAVLSPRQNRRPPGRSVEAAGWR
jgi:transcriptional regulator with XRE-family HTH domain